MLPATNGFGTKAETEGAERECNFNLITNLPKDSPNGPISQ